MTFVLAWRTAGGGTAHARDQNASRHPQFNSIGTCFVLGLTLSPTFIYDSNTLNMLARLSPLHILRLSRCQRRVLYHVRRFSGMSNSGLATTQIEVREAVQKICQEFPDEYWTEKDRYVTCFHIEPLSISHKCVR